MALLGIRWSRRHFLGPVRVGKLTTSSEEKLSSEHPRTGVPVVRSGIARRRRMLAFAALTFAVLAIAFVATRGGGGYQYQVVLQNAGLLVHGDVVRVGGVAAGSVDSLDLTPNGQA